MERYLELLIMIVCKAEIPPENLQEAFKGMYSDWKDIPFIQAIINYDLETFPLKHSFMEDEAILWSVLNWYKENSG